MKKILVASLNDAMHLSEYPDVLNDVLRYAVARGVRALETTLAK